MSRKGKARAKVPLEFGSDSDMDADGEESDEEGDDEGGPDEDDIEVSLSKLRSLSYRDSVMPGL